MKNKTLLILDDELEVAEFIGVAASQKGFEVKIATDAVHFKLQLRSLNPSILILDLMMPEVDGIEMIRYLADEKCKAALLLISGMDTKVLNTAARLGKSLKLNVLGTLQKPIMLDDFDTMIDQFIGASPPLSQEMLQTAIDERQLCVYYQPKIYLGNEKTSYIKGVEALVRWNHPDRGFLPPVEFIPLAEETGLIKPLTDFVLDEALHQVKEWENNNKLDLDVAVNIAPQLLSDKMLPNKIINKLNKLNIKSTKLTLEITESGLMEDQLTNITNLTRFRVNGINISIDDFGTGYSSLVQIYRMPFNELKIDKSFVMELNSNKEAKTIVKALIDLSHNLGLKVCAEGIETEATLAYLHELGCDNGQGYFFSPPIPGDDIPEWCEYWMNDNVKLQKVAIN